MKRQLFIILFSLPIAFNCLSQNLIGYVRDSESKEPLEFCVVQLLNKKIQVYTNTDGSFELEIPAASSSGTLVFLHPDYISDTIIFSAGDNLRNIVLKPIQTILEETVVTGVSKATLVKENPVPVVSISARSIDRTIESNIVDALVKNAPGLNAVKTGPNISKPFIRGLGYNRVLTLYDGIRQEGQQWGDEHGIEIDAYNVDRAEVIKGPSSIMYGSDAMAGVLSFFPAMPHKKDSTLTGKFMSEYQSNNGLIGSGLRAGICRKNLLFSLRGSMRYAKNYSNSVDERVYNTGFQEKNLSALAGYSGLKGFININATLYENLQGIPDGTRDTINHKFTKQVEESSNDHLGARPIVSDAELNSYLLSPLRQHIQHKRVYTNSHYNLGKGDISLQIAFQQSVRREYNHPTQPSQAGLYVRLNTVNYGLRYSLPKWNNLDIAFGINGMYQSNKNKNGTDFPIPDFQLTDIGTYAFAKYKKNIWTLSGGIRYDLRILQGRDFFVKTMPGSTFEQQAMLPDTMGAKLQFPHFDQRFQGISASLGATIAVTENISIKANIARGYRAPNIAEIASNGLDPGAKIVYIGNRSFLPEFNIQEDLGAEAKFQNYSWSVNVFHNFIENYIYLSQLADENGNPVVIVPGNKTFKYQQASALLYGFEASLNLNPVILKGFQFSNSLSTVYGYNKRFNKEGLNGEFLPFIPPIRLLSSLAQEIILQKTFMKRLALKAEVEWNGAQHRYMALYGTETFTPGYSLLNLSSNIEMKYAEKSFLSVQFQVNNVMNTSYQSNLSRLKYFGIYGMGRNFCVRIVLPF